MGLLTTALSTAACAGGEGDTTLPDAGPSDASLSDAPMDAAFEAAVRPVCTDGMTLPCICDDGGSGSRACVDGQLADTCRDCKVRAGSDGSPCEPGRYEGDFFVPMYLPTPASCVGTTLFGGPGGGSLAFTLRDTASNVELIQVVEAESCFEMELAQDEDAGNSSETAQNPAFSMTGEVDCKTGVFEAEIRGAYAATGLCTSDPWYSVKGTLRAVYDPGTKTFTDGTVDFYEPMQLGDMLGLSARAGGSGTWQATLDPDAERPEPVDDCLGGAVFTDFEI